MQDLNDGDVRWKLDDPKVLMKEVADKAAAAEEAARAKREKKLQKARDEVDKAKAAAAAPSELFRGDAARAVAYSQYDAEGVPTTQSFGGFSSHG